MRTFKLKGFARFCRDESIPDSALAEAVARAEAGLIDADLGGGVIKQRVARQGQGKSGGFRTIVCSGSEKGRFSPLGLRRRIATISDTPILSGSGNWRRTFLRSAMPRQGQ